MTGRTSVASFATPLEWTELRDLIRQYRRETQHQRNEFGLNCDDSWARCGDGAPLDVEEEGLLAFTRRRMMGKRVALDRRSEYEEDVDTVIGSHGRPCR